MEGGASKPIQLSSTPAFQLAGYRWDSASDFVTEIFVDVDGKGACGSPEIKIGSVRGGRG